jgi:SAM-dependent methyltransferase
MPAPEVVAYVRAALPPPPARVLEVGAGDGSLAAALLGAGYDVVAIDPAGEPPVLPLGLDDYEDRPRSFDAAVAVVSLHHVVPLGRSLRKLAGLLRRGARLVVDEFDGWALDERAAAWWLERAGADSRPQDMTPQDMIAGLREHVHPVAAIRESLSAWFDVGVPVPGAYLYRWKLDPALRAVEEELIAAGELPATGMRFVAVRR